MRPESLLKAFGAELLLIFVFCLRDSVTEERQCVFGFELDSRSIERCYVDEAHRERSAGIELAHLSSPQQQGGWMAGTDILEHAIGIEQPKKHGGITAHGCALAKKAVQMIEDFHR